MNRHYIVIEHTVHIVSGHTVHIVSEHAMLYLREPPKTSSLLQEGCKVGPYFMATAIALALQVPNHTYHMSR